MSAITTTTPIRFRFVSEGDFQALVNGVGGPTSDQSLSVGSLYFVGNLIHFVTSATEYVTIGSSQVGVPPLLAAEEGIWYYDPSTGAMKIKVMMKGGANIGTPQFITVTESFAGAAIDGTTGNIVFTRLDGTTLAITVPKATSISSLSTDAEYATGKSVYDYVSAQIGGVVGGVRFRDSLTNANIATMFTSGAKAGDMYRVGETITTPAVLAGMTVYAGDWVVFKTTTTTTPFTSSDFAIFRGVENAAADTPMQNNHVIPLSLHGAWLLDQTITGLSTSKMDILAGSNVGNAGQILQSTSDGQSARSGKLFSAGSLPTTSAGASVDNIPNEKQVVDGLLAKADLVGSGTANVVLTATATGGYQRTSHTLGNSTLGTSTTTLATEAAVSTALASVAASATLYWMLD